MANKFAEEKINPGTDDEMVIFGYRRSCIKTFFTLIAIISTCGLLLILLSWRRSVKMRLTHNRCSLDEANKVLLVDSYQQQYVEPVIRPTGSENLPKQHTYFYNKEIKYIWDPQLSKFSKIEGLEVGSCAHLYTLSQGLHTTEAVFRLQFYGKNTILVEVLPVLKLLLRELRSPFYIYQMFIVVVWLIQLYYQFAVCILLLSTISVSATVWETRKQSRALRDAVRTSAVITVLRDGREVEKSSDELVPGDVIILPESQFTMVCDAVLLSGNCVVNESMLTGESTPITKVPISNDPTLQYSSSVHKRSTLFCGTEILHSRSYEDGYVRAVVCRTGYATSKGELVRAILFPKPVNFKLYSDLLKCMIIFFCIGVIPIIYSTLIWIRLKAYVKDVVIIVADVITFLVPPVLPAVLTSINAHAQRRLRKVGIFCLNSRYINCCGMLDVVCFDKTGTLTSDSLDFSGAIPVEDSRFLPAVKDMHQLSKGPFIKAIASCHSLTKVNGKLLGHTLDVKLFEETGWDLDEPNTGDRRQFEKVPPRIVSPKYQSSHEPAPALAIVRQFPFESLLRRMSVVTMTEGSDCFEVYLKGAPELVTSLSLNDTVPEDFKEILEIYTRQGFRVIGIGVRSLPASITWDDVLQMKREDLECDLHFQGLIVLQNSLKPETVPTLKILKDADIRSIMVTGDNLLTAITVARDCGMIEEYDSVISVEAEIVQTSSTHSSQHLKINYSYAKLPGFSEKLNMIQNGVVDDMYLPMPSEGRYHIAIEGKSFNVIRLYDTQLLKKIVHKGTIFARMLPEHKLYLIETLQDLGHHVGMCGDGANDCGALKTANAGISLSVAEASVAAPFTATRENIECIPTVIKEGRGTLVTIFGAFRYMVCYCFVLLSAVLILFWDGQKPSDGGYVIVDIVLSLLPPILFGSTPAYSKLAKRRPMRSIISFVPLFSMLSFLFIQIGVLVLAYEYCLSQPWYEPFTYIRDKTHTPASSHSGTAILSVNMMSYVIAAVIFSPGPPYRQSMWTNKLFSFIILAEFILVSYLTIYPADPVARYINLKRAPYIEFHLMLYLISLANCAFSYVWEVLFVQGYLFEHVVPALRKFRGPIRNYEKLESEMAAKNDWPLVGITEGKPLSYDDEEDSYDVGTAKQQPSMTRRDHWARRSSELRRSLLVGLKLSKPSDRKDSKTEPMAFVTFRDGSHQTEIASSRQKADPGFI